MPSQRRAFVGAVVPITPWHTLQVGYTFFASGTIRETYWYRSMTHRHRRGNGSRGLAPAKVYIPPAPTGKYGKPAMLQGRMQEPCDKGIQGVLLPPSGPGNDPVAVPRGGLDVPVLSDGPGVPGLSPQPQGGQVA